MDWRFACDAMMGGLARWLWAAGCEAVWVPDIADEALVRLARDQQRVILTSDTALGRHPEVRRGAVRVVLVPTGLKRADQFRYVAAHLGLTAGPPRCMRCGGRLEPVDKAAVRAQVPARSYQWCQQFWRCQTCRQLFWDGTHWRRIQETLTRVVGSAAAQDDAEQP